MCFKMRWLGIAASLTLAACASTVEQDIKKLKVGMTKSEIVEVLGDPTKKFRHKGSDIWSYAYYVENKKNRRWKSIVFRKSTAVSIKSGDLEAALLRTATGDPSDEKERKAYRKMIKQKKSKAGFESL